MKVIFIILLVFVSTHSYSQGKIDPVFVNAKVDSTTVHNLEDFLQKTFRSGYFKYFNRACDFHSYQVKFKVDGNGNVENVRIEGGTSIDTAFIKDALRMTSGAWKKQSGVSKELILPVYFSFADDCDSSKTTERKFKINNEKLGSKRNGMTIDKITNDQVILSRLIFLGPYLNKQWDLMDKL